MPLYRQTKWLQSVKIPFTNIVIKLILSVGLAIFAISLSSFAQYPNVALSRNVQDSIFSAQGTISWTNPPLNSGAFVYQRVGISKIKANGDFTFIELGHDKGATFGYSILLAYMNLDVNRTTWPLGRPENIYYYNHTPQTRTFKILRVKHGVGNVWHEIWADNTWLDSVPTTKTKLGAGTYAFAGGETGLGQESVGNTVYYNLYYLHKNNIWYYWDTYSVYDVDPPYSYYIIQSNPVIFSTHGPPPTPTP